MWDCGAELTSTSHWFETELLTHKENLVGPRAMNWEVLTRRLPVRYAAAGNAHSADDWDDLLRRKLTGSEPSGNRLS